MFAFSKKPESSSHSAVAFDSSEPIWPRPDKAWVYIESDTAGLFVHTWCFGTGLLGLALARWRVSPPPSPNYPSHPHPLTDNIIVVLWGLELSVKGA